MVKNYTDIQLLDKVKSLSSFKNIPSGYWLLGVRSSEDKPNHFDDKIYLFDGNKFIMVTSCTTNPGTPILKNGFKSYNKEGAAVVSADTWHYDIWKYGLHKGKMPALLQIGAEIKIHRDGDSDDKSEELGKEQHGWYGINFHANTYNLSASKNENVIAGWSAGCQVVNDTPKYKKIIELIKAKGGKISYCLLNEF